VFERITRKVPAVSKVRFEQTLLAEYPEFSERLKKLEGEKTLQTPSSLARLWHTNEAEALACAYKLSDIGFFYREGAKDAPQFWVPFLYRSALSMVQGAAD
jgi:hypothetical protein